MPVTIVDPEAAILLHAADPSFDPASSSLLLLQQEDFLLVRQCTRSAACQTERVLGYPVVGGVIRPRQLVYRRDDDQTLEYRIEADALAIDGLADYHPGALLNGEDLEFLNGSDSPAPFLFTSGGQYIYLAPSVTARAGDLAEVSFTVAYEGATFDAARSGAARLTLDPVAPLTIIEGDECSIQLLAIGSAGLTPDWSATGLPSGLAIAESGYSAEIAGTVAGSGVYGVEVSVLDAASGATDSVAFALTVSPNVDMPEQAEFPLTSSTLLAALLADVLEGGTTFGRPVRITPFNGAPTAGGAAVWSPVTVSAWEISPDGGAPGARVMSLSDAVIFPATAGAKTVTHLRVATDSGTVIADVALAAPLAVPAATAFRLRPGRLSFSLFAAHQGSALDPSPAAIYLARLFGFSTDLGAAYLWLEYHETEPSNESSAPVAATTIPRTGPAWNITGGSAVTAATYQGSETAPAGGWSIGWRALRLAYPSSAPAMVLKQQLGSPIVVAAGAQVPAETVSVVIG
jgi:hypothetical protein